MLTLPVLLSSLSVLKRSPVCQTLVFCAVHYKSLTVCSSIYFSFDHCLVWPSTYRFWLNIQYLYWIVIENIIITNCAIPSSLLFFITLQFPAASKRLSLFTQALTVPLPDVVRTLLDDESTAVAWTLSRNMYSTSVFPLKQIQPIHYIVLGLGCKRLTMSEIRNPYNISGDSRWLHRYW